MAKDRFSNQRRSNYDKRFRYGDTTYTPAPKRNKILRAEHKHRIDAILSSKDARRNLNSWEVEFLIGLERIALASDKQLATFQKIIDRIKL